MVFVVPPILILAAWRRGCRPTERKVVAAIAGATAIAFVPALLWAIWTTAQIPNAVAYALVSMSTASLAMLIRRRPEDDDGGDEDDRDEDDGDPGSEDDGPNSPTIDWSDFERRFWKEVERRERQRVPS
jgi:hypothetical protein